MNTSGTISAGPAKSSHATADQWVDTRALADILNVSMSFLNKARLTGDGPGFAKFGKAVRYHVPTAKAWAESRMRRSTSEAA